MKLLNNYNIDKSITVFYFGFFFFFSTDFLGTKEASLLLMAMFLLAVFYHGQQVNIFFNLSLCPYNYKMWQQLFLKYQLPFYPLEHTTFHNLINHMQNLIKESPHLILPSTLKEHVQHSIQQYSNYIAFLDWRNKLDAIILDICVVLGAPDSFSALE